MANVAATFSTDALTWVPDSEVPSEEELAKEFLTLLPDPEDQRSVLTAVCEHFGFLEAELVEG